MGELLLTLGPAGSWALPQASEGGSCALQLLSFPAKIKVSGFVNKLSSLHKASASFFASERFSSLKGHLVSQPPPLAADQGFCGNFSLVINLKTSYTSFLLGAFLQQPSPATFSKLNLEWLEWENLMLHCAVLMFFLSICMLSSSADWIPAGKMASPFAESLSAAFFWKASLTCNRVCL